MKYYLRILPFYLLVGIVLSIFRSAYLDNYNLAFLLAGAFMDFIVVLFGKRYLQRRTITIVFVFLIVSLVVGLLKHNEISRRFITDFTNPFFFFAKIYIFAAYWDRIDFRKYIKYYSKVAFWGSLALLPVTYSLFQSADATRLAIFPPLELPFSSYMQSGGLFFGASLVMIILYGKRSQLVSAITTFLLFVFFFKRRKFIRYSVIFIIGVMITSYLFSAYSDNIAIRRISGTIERISSAGTRTNQATEVAGSRVAEIEAIMKRMETLSDYVFGKGLGFTYRYQHGGTNDLKRANAHFSPLGLLSKYGILFTIFLYLFLFNKLFKSKKALFDKPYLTAVGTCVFIFFESFFAYALFVMPIFPLALGYIIHRQTSSE